MLRVTSSSWSCLCNSLVDGRSNFALAAAAFIGSGLSSSVRVMRSGTVRLVASMCSGIFSRSVSVCHS
jgi:hypothetical protein